MIEKLILEECEDKKGFIVSLSTLEGIQAAFTYEGPIGSKNHYIIEESHPLTQVYERREIAHSPKTAKDLTLQYAREYLKKRKQQLSSLGSKVIIEERFAQSQPKLIKDPLTGKLVKGFTMSAKWNPGDREIIEELARQNEASSKSQKIVGGPTGYTI